MSRGKRTGQAATTETRQQAETVFTGFLRELVEGGFGVSGAVFFDGEGETVDHFSNMEEFQIKVSAAHIEIISRFAAEANRKICGMQPTEIVFSTPSTEFLDIPLGEGYHLGIIVNTDSCRRARLAARLPHLISEIKRTAGL